MFCSKCGKEIMDEAVICPNCGCYTENSQKKNTASSDFMAIQQFASAAGSLKVMGIFAAILCFGIGIIFTIIIKVRGKGLAIPEVSTTNVQELSLLEKGKRDLKLANTLSALPLLAIGISIIVGFVAGVMMQI